MNLSSKHQQSIVSYGNFTGGLNTTTVPEMIGDNQMADCINMEFNRTTGALQTCCGTATVFTCPEDITIDQLWYDEINNVFLFTDANTRSIYKSRLVDMDGTHAYDHEKIGVLTGERKPTAVMWENGMVIASGGRLQYWDGNTLETIQAGFDDEQKVYEWKLLGNSVAESEWACLKEYKFADIVFVGSKYYFCLLDHKSSNDMDLTYWKLLPNWAGSTSYKANDIVAYGGVGYRATTAHRTGTSFSAVLWVETTKSAIHKDSDGKDVTTYWGANIAYKVSNVVRYGDKNYECKVEHTSPSTFYVGLWNKLSNTTQWALYNKYNVDDVVRKDNGLYICTTAHTANKGFDKDTEKWQELTINNVWEYDKYYFKHKDVVKVDDEYYLAEESHTSVTDAPVVCNGVFVKNGRVAVWHEYTIQFSGIGDERCWYDLPDDDSTSKYQDVGYKEGEKEQAYIIGACALSNDIVIIKNDGKIYRLAGEYPNWVLKEIARDINCLNPQCYVSVQDGVFIVGREGMFLLSTTVDYGDVKPTNVASGIMGLLGILSVEESYVKFMPSLNQIWVAGYENRFICFDLTFKAFFQRQFNSKVTDVCRYKSYYMLSRKHSVTELMQGIFKDELYSDNESEMIWKIVAKTHTSFYEFLLKRMRIAYVPLMDEFNEASLITGEGKIIINLPERKKKTAQIVPDKTFIVSDSRLVFPMDTQLITKWMVYRDMRFGIKLEGKGSAIMINKIDSAIAEV